MKIFIPKLFLQWENQDYFVGFYASEEEAKIAIQTVINHWNYVYPQPPDSIDWKDFAIVIQELGDFDFEFFRFLVNRTKIKDGGRPRVSIHFYGETQNENLRT